MRMVKGRDGGGEKGKDCEERRVKEKLRKGEIRN
jgi:hypothetical protein